MHRPFFCNQCGRGHNRKGYANVQHSLGYPRNSRPWRVFRHIRFGGLVRCVPSPSLPSSRRRCTSGARDRPGEDYYNPCGPPRLRALLCHRSSCRTCLHGGPVLRWYASASQQRLVSTLEPTPPVLRLVAGE